jgi:hypothetical protein
VAAVVVVVEEVVVVVEVVALVGYDGALLPFWLIALLLLLDRGYAQWSCVLRFVGLAFVLSM